MGYLPGVWGRTCFGAMFAEASTLGGVDLEGNARAGHIVLSRLGEGKKNGIWKISQRNIHRLLPLWHMF